MKMKRMKKKIREKYMKLLNENEEKEEKDDDDESSSIEITFNSGLIDKAEKLLMEKQKKDEEKEKNMVGIEKRKEKYIEKEEKIL